MSDNEPTYDETCPWCEELTQDFYGKENFYKCCHCKKPIFVECEIRYTIWKSDDGEVK